MKVCTFRRRSEPESKGRVGIVTERGHVVETNQRLTMHELLNAGPRALQGLLESSGAGVSQRDVVLMAPVPRPGKILAAIVNTRAMLGGRDISLDRPRIDMKAPSAVIGPNETIESRGSDIRPEVELAAVIGRRASRVGVDSAKRAIFGYTVLNDVTAPKDSRADAYEAYRRSPESGELKKVTLRGPLFRSKNHDTFCPMGPWIVTSEEAGDTSALTMTTTFRGELVQQGSTSEYIFSPAQLVSYISSFLTLEPGDVVSCGSVGWTAKVLGNRDPTEYVCTPGKGLLELSIERVGTLRNRLAAGLAEHVRP
jgi:2-keto-4-pentenoate hydratase/2-oxohepta-3-ene-1,7-dioic acid hydratase in catechol pathway